MVDQTITNIGKIVKEKKLLWILWLFLFLRVNLDIFSNFVIFKFKKFPPVNFASLIGFFAVLLGVSLLLSLKFKFKKIPLFFPISIFLCFGFISVFYSIDKLTSSREFIRILSIFSIYSLSFFLIKTKKAFKTLINVILISSLIPVILGIYQYSFHKGMTSDISGFSNRIYGTFAHPNSFAIYLLIILSILLFYFFYTRKLLFGVGVLFLSLLLCLTYSRIAWLGFILIIFIIGMLKYRKLLLTSLCILLLVYLIIPSVSLRINELFELDPYGSVVWRIKLWKDMTEVFKEKPIQGFGIGTFNVLTENIRGVKFGSTDAHNDYLKISVELGILGLISYLFLIFNLLKILWQRYIKGTSDKLIFLENSHKNKLLQEQKLFSLILFALCVSVFAMAFADNLLKATAIQWIFWALIGGFMGLARENPAPRLNPTPWL